MLIFSLEINLIVISLVQLMIAADLCRIKSQIFVVWTALGVWKRVHEIYSVYSCWINRHRLVGRGEWGWDE